MTENEYADRVLFMAEKYMARTDQLIEARTVLSEVRQLCFKAMSASAWDETASLILDVLDNEL